MGLKDIYYSLEDKYYGFLDWLDEKGVPVYGLVDAIEASNIPSFPVFVLVVLLLLFGIFFLAGGMNLFGGQSSVVLSFADSQSGNSINNSFDISYRWADNAPTTVSVSDGQAKFNAPIGQEITLNITAPTDYEDATETFTIPEDYAEFSKKIRLDPKITLVSKTIKFKNSETQQLLSDSLFANFDCTSNSEFFEQKQVVGGEIRIDNIPSDCGELVVDIVGDNYTVVYGRISLSGTAPEVLLEPRTVDKGSAYVSVKNADGDPLSNILVQIYSSDGFKAREKYSNTSGTVEFLDIDVGSYYLVASDSEGTYKPLTTTSKQISKDSVASFDAVMESTTSSKLTVKIIDADTKSAVQSAMIEIRNEQSYKIAGPKYSDSSGEASFDLPSNAVYNISVEKSGYITARTSTTLTGSSTVQVFISTEDISNTGFLEIEVVDLEGLPIQGAMLVLKDADDHTVIDDSKATGSDGKAEYTLEEGLRVYVEAKKSSFPPSVSEQETIIASKISSLKITLSIGSGTAEVNVKNETGETVPGTKVEKIDAVTGAVLSSAIADSEGKAIIKVREDEVVFFRIDESSYAAYNTPSMSTKEGETRVFDVVLSQPTAKLELKPLGMFFGDERVQSGSSLVEGQLYTGKYILSIPQGIDAEQAGALIVAGETGFEKTNIMENDGLFIYKVYSSAKSTARGTSYSPPGGYSQDRQNLTSGSAKWAEVLWNNPEPGDYEIDVLFQVNAGAEISGTLKIGRRAWVYSNAKYARSPQDSELGSAGSVATKQGFYAQLLRESYAVGGISSCTASFCKEFKIQDTSTGELTSVISSYNAKLDKSYRLYFDFSSISSSVFTNSKIKISSTSNSLELEDYSILDASGKVISGNASGYELETGISTIANGSTVSGNILFKTKTAGMQELSVEIQSSEGSTVFEKKIYVDVPAPKTMSIDILPKIIVPFIDNTILVHVSSEEEDLGNATVSVYVNSERIGGGITSSEGVYSYELEAPNSGDVVRIIAEKSDYATAGVEINIEENVVLLTPPLLSVLLNTNSVLSKETPILAENLSTIPFTIKEIEISENFEGLVEFNWAEDYRGQTIDLDPVEGAEIEGEESEEKILGLVVSLTRQGLLVEETTTLEGVIEITLTNPVFKKDWIVTLPVSVRIGLGGEVDEPNCIEFEPFEWSIETDTQKKVLTSTLRNNCKVNGVNTPLRNIEIAIEKSGEENLLGEFSVASSELGISSTKITETSRPLTEFIEAGREVEFTFTFDPEEDIESGESNPNIVFKAVNITDNGNEELTGQINASVSVNDLTQCLKFKMTEPIQLVAAPISTGYGMYSQLGYNPNVYGGSYGASNYYTNSSPWAGFSDKLSEDTLLLANQDPRNMTGSTSNAYGWTTPYPFGGSSTGTTAYQSGMAYGSYPNPAYSMGPGFLNQFDSSYYNQWQYGQQMISIENDCGKDVEIKLETGPYLNSDKEEIELASGDGENITLIPGYRMGRFSVEVKARLAGSEEKHKKVREINVMITTQGFMDKDCIKIVPPSKLKLTDIIGRPLRVKVYNYCYDTGVHLQDNAQTLSIDCPGLPDLPEPQRETTANAAGGGELDGIAQKLFGKNYGELTSEAEKQAVLKERSSLNASVPAKYDAEGTCKLVDQIWFAGESRQAAPGGGIVQVVELEIKPNIDYRERAALQLKGKTFTQIGQLRAYAQEAYFRVQARGTAKVNYYDSFKQKNTTNIPVVIEDLFLAGPYLEPYEGGNPAITQFQDCIDTGALNVVEYWMAKGFGEEDKWGFVPDTEFEIGDYEFIPTPNKVMKISPNFCGALDKLANLRPVTWTHEKSGVMLGFSVIDNGHNVKLTIDRSSMTMMCARIETRLSSDLTRATHNVGTQRVNIPVKVWVLNEGIDLTQVDADFLKTCEDEPYYSQKERDLIAECVEKNLEKDVFSQEAANEGFTDEQINKMWRDCQRQIQTSIGTASFDCGEGGKTGTGAFNEYGFDRLLFDWDSSNIIKSACDEPKEGFIEEEGATNFCDAAQFTLTLDKKVDSIKTYIEKIDSVIKDTEHAKMLKRALCEKGDESEDSCLDDYKNTENIYRWAKEQFEIFDNKNNKTLVFFESESGVLEGEKLNIEDYETAKSLAEIIDIPEGSSDIKTIITQMSQVFGKLEERGKAKNIVAVVEKNSDTEKFYNSEPKLYKMGAKEVEGIGYVMAYGEWKNFHNQLESAMKRIKADKSIGSCETDIETCYIDGLLEKNGSTKITATGEFMNTLLKNIRFVNGIREKEEMTDGEIEIILKNGKNRQGLDTGELEKVYYQDISFESYLMEDGFSEDFKSDFDSTGFAERLLVGGVTNWDFSVDEKNTGKHSAGKYSVKVNYNWENREIEINLSREQALSEIDSAYAKNIFFKMPFDGKLGLADGTRQGYGVAVSSEADISEMLLNYSSEAEKQAVFKGTGALANYLGEVNKDYANANSGMIFHVESKQITYNPSYPVALKLEIADRYGEEETGSEGLLYEILDAASKEPSYGSAHLFEWKSASDTITDKLVSQKEAANICEEIGESHYGFVKEIEGIQTYNTVALLPYNKEYLLSVYCTQGKSNITARQMGKMPVPKEFTPGYRKGDTSLKIKDSTKYQSIKTYLDMVKDRRVCIKDTSSSRISLVWARENLDFENIGKTAEELAEEVEPKKEEE